MNHKIWSLTKVFLQNSFQRTKENQKSNTNIRKIGMMIAYTALFIYIASIFGFISFGMISSLKTIGQEAVFLGVFFLAIAILTLLQSAFSGINVFYFSKDVEFILPLPLKPREILMAKLNVMLITEYITEILFGLVPLIIYGVLTGAGLLYYCFAFLFLLIFPILPVLISTFFVMIIMTFAKFTKNRDKFQFIATIMVVAIVLGIQMQMTGSQQVSQEQAAQMLVQANGTVDMIGNYFITLKPTIQGLIANDFIQSCFEFIKVLGITAIAYIIYIAIGQKVYFRGAVGNTVGGTTKKKKGKRRENYSKANLMNTYVKKEFKILIRNPIFFMQCVLPNLIMPVLFFFITQKAMINAQGMEEVGQMIQLVTPYLYHIECVCIILVVIQFFSMMDFNAITAISRDGLNATFMKAIPVPFYKQITYKIVPSVILKTVVVILTLGAVYSITKLNILFLLAIGVIATIMNILQSYLLIIRDLKKPKLEWNTEYAVVKQNISLVWPVIFSLVTIGLLILIGAITSPFPVWVGMIGIIVILGIILYRTIKYIKQNEVKLFEKIS